MSTVPEFYLIFGTRGGLILISSKFRLDLIYRVSNNRLRISNVTLFIFQTIIFIKNNPMKFKTYYNLYHRDTTHANHYII